MYIFEDWKVNGHLFFSALSDITRQCPRNIIYNWEAYGNLACVVIACSGIKSDLLEPASGVGVNEGKKQSGVPSKGKFVMQTIASSGPKKEVANVRLR